jgi:hypothetical protein
MAVEKIRVTVQVAGNFARYHANGVFGGLNPRGELEMYLTQDIVPVPEAVELAVGDGHAISELILPGTPTRIAIASVTFPIDALPSIIAWMQEKVEESRKRREIQTRAATQKPDSQ